jgi:hypothetical protein
LNFSPNLRFFLRAAYTFQVNIELDEDFDGVIYTRGSYAGKDKDCFLQAKQPGRKFRMKIPFDKCGTKTEGDVVKTVLIIQYDEFLIMPGDAAFELECNLGPTVAEITLDSSITTQPQLRYSNYLASHTL